MWQRGERLFYWVAIVAAFLGVGFALLKGSIGFAMFDAGFGVLFTAWLLGMEKKR